MVVLGRGGKSCAVVQRDEWGALAPAVPPRQRGSLSQQPTLALGGVAPAVRAAWAGRRRGGGRVARGRMRQRAVGQPALGNVPRCKWLRCSAKHAHSAGASSHRRARRGGGGQARQPANQLRASLDTLELRWSYPAQPASRQPRSSSEPSSWRKPRAGAWSPPPPPNLPPAGGREHLDWRSGGLGFGGGWGAASVGVAGARACAIPHRRPVIDEGLELGDAEREALHPSRLTTRRRRPPARSPRAPPAHAATRPTLGTTWTWARTRPTLSTRVSAPPRAAQLPPPGLPRSQCLAAHPPPLLRPPPPACRAGLLPHRRGVAAAGGQAPRRGRAANGGAVPLASLLWERVSAARGRGVTVTRRAATRCGAPPEAA